MKSDESDKPAVEVPLVVDLDGTLLRTDLLYETFLAALGHDMRATLGVSFTSFRSPARLKHALAAIAMPSADTLPLDDDVLNRVRAASDKGRPVHLVSGAAQRLVDALAARLGLPGPHFGSDPDRNLTGDAKARLLTEVFGRRGYDYAGNAAQDLAAWESARAVIAVAPSQRLRRRLQELGKPVEIIERRWSPLVLLRELRPHQWVKNLLLFAPLLVAHNFDPALLAKAGLAAIAFSLGASAIYVLNDLLDLEADRRHPEKRNRPIASGVLPIPAAVAASAVLAGLAMILALAVGPPVAALTLLYMAGSLVYSLVLKKRRWVDVIALASLFLLRIVAGIAATGVGVPPILLALGFAVFLALACVKRLTALSRLGGAGNLPGRLYTATDLLNLERVAYGSVALVAVLFAISALGPHGSDLYQNRLFLIAAGGAFIVWLLRLVWLGISGREDYDTVRFVLHDGRGWAILLAGLLLVVLAA